MQREPAPQALLKLCALSRAQSDQRLPWPAARPPTRPQARRHGPSQVNTIGGRMNQDIGRKIGTGLGAVRSASMNGGTAGSGSTERGSARHRGGQTEREHGVTHHALTTRLGLIVVLVVVATYYLLPRT